MDVDNSTLLTKSERIKNVVFVIFGITGNLARYKLVCSLCALYKRGGLSKFLVVGFARRPWTQEIFLENMRHIIKNILEAEETEAFLRHFRYISASFEEIEGYQNLKKELVGYKRWIFYLATPPSSYPEIVQGLDRVHLTGVNEQVSLVVEKPFGEDFNSSLVLNDTLCQSFDEEQIFRIDHYLGKYMAQNLFFTRFYHPFLWKIWNEEHINSITVTAYEKEGISTRADFYDATGALKDMIQSHLLQFLALAVMDMPENSTPLAISQAKTEALAHLTLPKGDLIESYLLRAQYQEGPTGIAYRDEAGIPKDSKTETYVACRLTMSRGPLKGVPLYLKTGKALSRKKTEVSIAFKARTGVPPAVLCFEDQPVKGMSWSFNNHQLADVPLIQMPLAVKYNDYSIFRESLGDYTLLLLKVFQKDRSFFVPKEQVEWGWRLVDDIQKLWKNLSIDFYDRGGREPQNVERLFNKQ